ncbi:DUF3817 domain-containing protein [Nocardioides sp. GY 10113]|uniref:DUF3817 domain-containing protein n=1 Tax=Nocardioides sp. GY 10113 TaxID=2569761 RepID=UPI0010A82543|nr:DUF3817 domain-containing protein [Nocardioides sp. GY 10113]TIC83217.1 DUF3817 domain-containing protein [Nocardioides sp. GY 10113]
MTPTRLFRRVAIAEVVTWALLLFGMYLKYGSETTELGVRVFGMLHGVVFVAYVVTTVLVAVDQRWRPGRALLALAAAVPPFATLPLEWRAVKRGWLADTWRLRADAPTGLLERSAAWVLRRPLRGAVVGALAVAALTGAALLVGPPTA